MNNEINYVSPFKRFCITIGNLPTAYLESMSYYEGLTYLVNYLSNNVIPALNNNGEAVEELQEKYIELKNYVDNYFEDLDIQQEIDNKLDEMVEDGTLINILAEYLQTQIIYDTHADMMADSANIPNNAKIQTLGYYDINDGGGALYYITDSADSDAIQDYLGNGLYTNLVIENNTINVKKLGAKADNASDNTTVFNQALSFANKYAIYFPKGNYKCSYLDIVNVENNIKIYGDNANIKLLDHVITADSQRLIDLQCEDDKNIIIEISGLNIDMNYTNNNDLVISSSDDYALQHCHAIFIYGSTSNIDVLIHDINFNDLIADGINLGGSSTKIIQKAIINNITSKNRTATRSDICVTCDFDSLNCSDMILDKFEIEVNSRRNNVRRTILLNNLDLKDTLDLDVDNNDGNTYLSASNIKVDNYFYTDIENANYDNCTFKLDNYVRLKGKKIKFDNCNFYTKNNDTFNIRSDDQIAYMYIAIGDILDVKFNNCNIEYNNTALAENEPDSPSKFLSAITMDRVEFNNCYININSKLLEYRGGDTYINNCTFKTSNNNLIYLINVGSNNISKDTNVYLYNNITTNDIYLYYPAIAGSYVINIFENNPCWKLGKVLYFTRFDKITSFNGGTGVIVTIKELTKHTNDSEPNNGIWIKGQIVYNSNPSTNYGWICTKSGNFGGSPTPTFSSLDI